MPLIGELIDWLRDAQYFTKIDLQEAYNLVQIAPGKEWKTLFKCWFGHFEYKVMPFGLTNASASFQALINGTLQPCLDHFACTYLDNIVVYLKDLWKHIQHVQDVLRQLRTRGLFVQEDKCKFDKEVIEFFGFVIGRKFIQMDPKKVALVASWPEPTCLKHFQAFLGFANFYRWFIKDYSQQTLGITKLLKKDRVFQWNNKAQASFETLKRAFIHEKIFQHFQQSIAAVLETNASDKAIGGCLS